MRRNVSWRRAQKLCPLTQSAMIYAASCLLLRLLLLILGYVAQRSLPQTDSGMLLLGIISITANALVLAPTEITMLQWLAKRLHLVNAQAAPRSRLTLWRKWCIIRICADCTVLVCVLPSAVLCGLALRLAATPPHWTDGAWALLLSAHLLMLSILLLALPLRARALCAALPLYALKFPDTRISAIFRMAVRATRHRSRHILLRRAACIPLLISPRTALRTLPVLLTAELTESNANSDKIICAHIASERPREACPLEI